MIGAGQHRHCVAMRKRRLVTFGAEGMPPGNDKMDFIQVKPALRCASDGQMTDVNGIERPAKEGNRARAQGMVHHEFQFSPAASAARKPTSAFSTGAEGARRARLSAMALTSAGTPSPLADEML